MLSGGSDSRLILAALTAADRGVRAFHMNDWHNVEAEITRRVAETAGVPITFLRRDRDYQARALVGTADRDVRRLLQPAPRRRVRGSPLRRR